LDNKFIIFQNFLEISGWYLITVDVGNAYDMQSHTSGRSCGVREAENAPKDKDLAAASPHLTRSAPLPMLRRDERP
jgi:hypothetical protein